MAIQNELPLKNVQVCIIKALHQLKERGHGPEFVYPTLMDLALMDVYMPTIYAYRLADSSSAEYMRFLERLKSSLEKILVPFFAYGGRWLLHKERMRHLVCNDEGVPFVEAEVDRDLDSVVISSGKFLPVAGLNGHRALGMDPFQVKQSMRPEGLPPVIVQVTRFKCGGVVLGATFNHMHADAQSFTDFMASWAEMGRTNQVTIQPSFNRSLGMVYEKMAAAMAEMAATTQSQPGTEKVEAEGPVQQPSYSSPLRGFDEQSAWSIRAFEVNRSVIQDMKSAVPSSDREKGAYISTNDCIHGHFWKSLFYISDSYVDKSRIFVNTVVEGRQKFYDPPLQNLCGNVFTSMVAPKVAPEELMKEPAYVTAQRHREKLRDIKREEWLTMERMKEEAESMAGALLVVNSWYKFPLYDIDFGVGGRPYFSGPNFCYSMGMKNFLGVCIITPPVPGHSSSAASIVWTGPSKILEELESSPDFMSFFLDPSQ